MSARPSPQPSEVRPPTDAPRALTEGHPTETQRFGLARAGSRRDNAPQAAGTAAHAALATEDIAVRHHGIRFLGAASVLGAALLFVTAGGVAAGHEVQPAGSAFAHRQVVRAGSFSEIAEAVDTNGKVHIAAGDNQDVWYLTNRTGSWTSTRVFVHTASPNGVLWGQPTIALDDNNRVHIAATRFPYGEGGIGIFYATDVGHPRGTFGTPTRLASNALGEPQLKVYHGNLFLVAVKNWCCVGDGTVLMRTNKSGPWTEATIGSGQYPSFQMTSDGYARVLYERGDSATGLYYAVAGSHKGNFTTAHIPGTNSHDGGPQLAVRNDQAQITWRHGNSGAGNWQFSYAASSGWHSFLTVPNSTSNMAGAIGATSTGFAHVTLAGGNPLTDGGVEDHYRCGSEPPLTWCNDYPASNVRATAVASAGGPSNTLDVTWIQNGDIWFAVGYFPGP